MRRCAPGWKRHDFSLWLLPFWACEMSSVWVSLASSQLVKGSQNFAAKKEMRLQFPRKDHWLMSEGRAAFVYEYARGTWEFELQREGKLRSSNRPFHIYHILPCKCRHCQLSKKIDRKILGFSGNYEETASGDVDESTAKIAILILYWRIEEENCLR